MQNVKEKSVFPALLIANSCVGGVDIHSSDALESLAQESAFS